MLQGSIKSWCFCLVSIGLSRVRLCLEIDAIEGWVDIVEEGDGGGGIVTDFEGGVTEGGGGGTVGGLGVLGVLGGLVVVERVSSSHSSCFC